MSTRQKLLERISHIEDESILEDLLKMIELELDLKEDVVKLTDQEKKAVDEGLKDIEEGRVFSHEEARKIVDEWRKKR